MSRLATTFVLGYHGCSLPTAERLLDGEPFKQSRNVYDWLGKGVYFWEANPLRALQFAKEQLERRGGKRAKPGIVGAVIDLGLCLDLTTSPSHQTNPGGPQTA